MCYVSLFVARGGGGGGTNLRTTMWFVASFYKLTIFNQTCIFNSTLRPPSPLPPKKKLFYFYYRAHVILDILSDLWPKLSSLGFAG